MRFLVDMREADVDDCQVCYQQTFFGCFYVKNLLTTSDVLSKHLTNCSVLRMIGVCFFFMPNGNVHTLFIDMSIINW